ncbi:hypothetical protein F5890DRAFT_1542186 [Lentinula detonsa]|uniref:Uncharacterized protein n=1 Tax=Lentinula detonsa TaxID=2804962 RepID=A0AA38PR36_9AGAR|nr:hypothetical protein F5890DRAFT_1542186 [Lentinula detonsa]
MIYVSIWYVNDDAPSSSFSQYVDFKGLLHIAVHSKDKLPRGTHVTGGIPYPGGFTGKDIARELLINHDISTSDR